tara:strand:+ start:144 stop:548 length:405 start_codon:yes stop_codon:yes gene_type:complete
MVEKKIIIYDTFWNIKDTRENPNYLFVFGDNDIKKGKKGQAVIRDEPNALGIPTKKFPSFNISSFYYDSEFEDNKKKIDLAINNIIKNFMKKKYTRLVIPSNGLGTGLSKLNIKAPKTFKYLESKINAIKILFS